MMQRGRTLLKATACFVAIGALTACASVKGPEGDDHQPGQSRDSGSGGGFGIPFFGNDGNDSNEGNSEAETGGIGVNSFLWRSSLDTLNFMPLASADPFGGVIITDWYTDPNTPNERFKATVYILDTRLRADALNVSIFRQTRDASGAWADAAVDPATATQIENAILRRARELRLSALGDGR